ncbi:MAG: S46 family peptidase [Acidobacteriota bacterium]
MWTPDHFPAEVVKERYGVDIDQAWLDHVRRSTVRLEGGCTGSFVSADGLVLTNHHCARPCLSRLSSADDDLEANGFLARGREDERACPAEQISVLIGIEDITARITAAVRGKGPTEAGKTRRQTLTRLESACEEAAPDDAPVACETVSLYAGSRFHMYTYHRYDDVRLVFAPEASIAAFGGDPDNFNFPRTCLDMAFLRVYEHGRPARTPDHLTLRPEGAVEGEPVFVSGHPGSTRRLLTVAQLTFLRNVVLPPSLLRASELRGRLIEFGTTGNERHRLVQGPLLGIENSIKVRRNQLFALLDDGLMAHKRDKETALRDAVARDASLNKKYGSAWSDIEAAYRAFRPFHDEYVFLEQGAAFGGRLFSIARTLVRAAAERPKPNDTRLREYTDAALPALRQRLAAPRPIHADLEEMRLSFSLAKMREWLGPDDATVKQVLGTTSPEALARRLVQGTKLAEPGVRTALWNGGQAAIDTTDDPMIDLARSIDGTARVLRARYEDEVEAVEDAAAARIARVRFALHGTSTYPDATFTLRVSFGTVSGWDEAGTRVPPFTTLGAVYDRATGEDPFRLPQSWLDARPRLHLDKRFDFAASTDITGGNSGSPVIDRDGNLVGLIFDGNIHSIAGSFWFDPAKNRSVAVHPAAMLEALRVIYRANGLVDEIGGSTPPAMDSSRP